MNQINNILVDIIWFFLVVAFLYILYYKIYDKKYKRVILTK